MSAKDFVRTTAAFTAGIIVSIIAVYPLGYTNAIAIPAGFLEFFGVSSLFVWNLFVVNFIGIGIIAFLLALFVFRAAKNNRVMHGLAALSGIFVGAYVIVPWLHGMPVHFPFTRPWSAYGFELSIALAFLAAWLVTGRRT
jgi:hypothetical protein